MPLREQTKCRQVNHEGLRRWFSDDFFNLIVWYDYASNLTGFQLCYDKPHRERALTWRKLSGYTHHQIDDGDVTGSYKRSPLLVADGEFPGEQVVDHFRRSAASLEAELAAFVQGKLEHYCSTMVFEMAQAQKRRR